MGAGTIEDKKKKQPGSMILTETGHLRSRNKKNNEKTNI